MTVYIQTTQLTVNCMANVTFQNDSNMTCNTVFTYQGDFLWVTMTTSAITKQTLSADSSAGPVMIKAGCVVTEQIMGDIVVVTFTGTIVDSGSVNDLNNMRIGNFSKAPPAA